MMIERLGHLLAQWLLPVNVWTAVLLAGAALCDRALERRTRASLRIALYAPVALRVLLPFSWSITLARVPQVATLLPVDRLTATSVGGAASTFSWTAALAVGYLVVAGVLAIRAAVRRSRLARAVAEARPARAAIVDGTTCELLVHRDLGPMVVGLTSPRVVLPEAMLAEANDDALACVLRHEAAHLRRGDAWLAAAMEVLLVAFWPVAPLWLAAKRVRDLVELACDESALDGADPAQRRRYGHVLLDMAEQGPVAFAGAGSLHFGSTLRSRIEAIALHHPWPRAAQVGLVATAVATFAACSSTAPTTAGEPTAGTKLASTSPAKDEYGYQYDQDSARATPAPAGPTRNADGRLAPEVIQNVVRQSFGSFRDCYEAGQKKNAKLEGIVSVKYTINEDGTTAGAADEHSTLPDADVVQCVVTGFGKLTYPAPQGGIVTVIYPVIFKPGD